MKLLAIIPARAGSQRLRNKNLLELDGRPLVAHSCEAARACGAFDRICVNTDCPQIAQIAGEHGAECPALRPPHCATAEAPMRDAVVWLIDLLAEQGESYDAFAILQPTSPLRTADDIRAGVAIFDANAPCDVVAVTPVAPSAWLGEVRPDGRFDRWDGEAPAYRLNGALYLHRTEDYLRRRPPRKTIAYVMPASRSIDIDTAEDLEHAACLLRHGGVRC